MCPANRWRFERNGASRRRKARDRLFGYLTQAADLRLLPAGLYLRHEPNIGRGEKHGRARRPFTAQPIYSVESQQEK